MSTSKYSPGPTDDGNQHFSLIPDPVVGVHAADVDEAEVLAYILEGHPELAHVVVELDLIGMMKKAFLYE